MFSSVRERALQIANGQYQAAPALATPEPEKVAKKDAKTPKTPSKTVNTKFAPEKSTPAPPKTPSKTSSKEKTSSKDAPSTPKPSKTAAPRSSSPKSSSKSSEKSSEKKSSSKESSSKSSKDSKDSKDSSSKSSHSKSSTPKTPVKASSSKPSSTDASTKSSSSKSSSSKSTSKTSSSSTKKTPSKSSSSKSSKSPTTDTAPKLTPLNTRMSRILPEFSIGAFGSATDAPLTPDDEKIADLKAACLKQASSVTGGRSLAIVLKQRTSGEWFAALKDTNSDRYLTMWMNRDETFPTQVEALEAYLVFAKKMRNSSRLFVWPMSPKAGSKKNK